MKQLAEPFKLLTRAAERFNDLCEGIEKTLGLLEIVLQFTPPEELDACGEPHVNIGLYDRLPQRWYEPPPAAEILLESKSSCSRVKGGNPTLTRTLTWRVLDEVHSNPDLFSDISCYVDNRPQLALMIKSLKTFEPVEDIRHGTSP